MKRTTSIKFKAAFILAVFAMNTVVGSACAMGVDMGFNHKHHHEEVADHHHDEIANHHNDEKDDSDKDGCCNDAVIKFQEVDKNLTQNAKINIDSPVILLTFNSLLSINLFNISACFLCLAAIRHILPVIHNYLILPALKNI